MGSYYIADLVMALMVAQKRGATVEAGTHGSILLMFERDLPSPMDMDTLRSCGFAPIPDTERGWISPHQYLATD